VAAVGTTSLRLVQGIQGWTALPRLAAWLCVPAIIAGAAAGLSQIVGSVGGIAVLFGMVGMLTTPVAALLILILSLLRRWRLQVLGVLWLLVTVAMGLRFLRSTLPCETGWCCKVLARAIEASRRTRS